MKEKHFFENHEGILKIGIPYTKKLFEKNSKFQNVKILKTKGYGNMLINDNVIMTCERDEFIYHEMMAHVPLFLHSDPQDVLIIGGGDGGTAREVLKHKKVKNCIMVEIDSTVVKACKKHLPQTASVFKHAKLDLRIEEGTRFLKDKQKAFDVILVDSSDPIGPSSLLFGKNFYKNIYKALKAEGIVIAQAGNFFYNLTHQKQSLKMCLDLGFKKIGIYSYNNLTYPPGCWNFLFASKKIHPLKDFKAQRVKQSKIKFQYYNSDIHISSFTKPEFVKKQLKLLGVL
ncbi:MAG: polyamine aminopropyltransferase [Bdellovibrionales bacterium]|nr:polyamine aminopropyltransferase [Bdellovibrionales bacterium]